METQPSDQLLQSIREEGSIYTIEKLNKRIRASRSWRDGAVRWRRTLELFTGPKGEAVVVQTDTWEVPGREPNRRGVVGTGAVSSVELGRFDEWAHNQILLARS